ncbi:3-oxoadipate enol-lactonase [Faunimonas pinastri]|uniref:3-oxoadipate enol-lactonase n=1 Tax=Faunimonas pinastri TaxID=1855383 RepID=A0A1H9D2I6_9HYPH|nr:3-oxoadipate enol-lactonase [Faunimonas pinastri]SEQ07567.1 3-oxoadipate enol-lactonase [Faunimonas pinastri]
MSKFQTSDGIAIRYEESGRADGPVLIFSNSLGTDLRLWNAQLQSADAHFRVIRYDQRGHGESESPEGDYTIERLGADVLDLMDALGISQASYVGISMGAMTGLWLGMNHPRRFTRLVLASVSPFLPPKEDWDERIQTIRDEGLEPIADSNMERWFTPEFRQAQPEIVARLHDMVAANDPVGYCNAAGALRDMDLRDKLGLVESPVMVLIGDRDPVTPAKMAEQVLQRIPGSQSRTLQAAHLLNVEQPEAFNKAVMDFLTQSE